MNEERRRSVIALVVPGRRDRAFYKTFYRLLASKAGAGFEDLDSRGKLEEKRKLLRSLGLEGQRGSSIVRLLGAQSTLTVVVIPAEEDTVSVAAAIAGFQLGLSRPLLDLLVIAEDAEDMSFEERLTSLRDSLRSQLSRLKPGPSLGFNVLDRGEYYEHIQLHGDRAAHLNLLLIAQGLRDTSRLAKDLKHAVEDYIIYVRGSLVKGILERCPMLSGTSRRGFHKKAAQLVALAECHPDVEAFINRGLNVDDLDKLVNACDALRKLADIASTVLSL